MKKTFVLPPKTKLKLFLDECLSPDVVQALRLFLGSDYPNLVIDYLADYFAKGEGDEVWLPKLTPAGDWIVVTKDHGRDPKKPKLPDICKRLSITHIVISETISTNMQIKHALVTVFPYMLACSYLPHGTEVRLNLTHLKGSGTPIPTLTIEGRRIDLWCLEKKIQMG